jgi:anaerobic magnesium-protoporphyrin IX monomethyl ester cyclase
MKILLVQPPVVLNENEIPQFSPPLGLAYIAAVLQRGGHAVKILDTVILDSAGHKTGEFTHLGLPWEKIRQEISGYRPELVGISSMFSCQAESMHRVARLSKEVGANVITVVGGVHPSSLPELTLADPNINYAVLGEGERTALELVDRLSGGSPVENMAGIAYRKGGEIVVRPRAPFIEDLDELPFPAWDLLEMDKYARLSAGHGPLVLRKPLFTVVTSRGCPGRCIFCSVHNVFGSRWRSRSPGNVLDEIQALKERYGINQVDFEDDALLLDKPRIEAICDGLVERGIDISWATPNGVHIRRLDRQLLAKLKKSGCFALSFGIESGSERVRNDIIKKPIPVGQAVDAIRACREFNIWTHGFFVIGFPGENAASFRETIDFAQKLNLDSANFFIAAPYPKTQLLEFCRENGYVPRDVDYTRLRVADAIIRTDQFSPADMVLWQQRAYREFGKYSLKREILHFNLLRRLLRVRSRNDFLFLYRLAMRFFKRMR